MNPSVLVTGASSQIGWFAIPELVARGFNVSALTRTGKPGPFPDFEQVAWETGAQNRESGQNCQYLLSLGPLELAARAVRKNEHFRAVSAVSTSSVETKMESADPKEAAQVSAILEQEQQLFRVCSERNIPCSILRPTLIYGCGLDQNLTRLYRFICKFGFLPLASNADGLRQPLHAHDLALGALSALSRPLAPAAAQPLCGGSTLSYREMVTHLFSIACKPVRLINLPPGLLAGGVRIAQWVVPGFSASPQMVHRQVQDLVFDDSKARAQLDVAPRAFAPATGDFELPTTGFLEQLARKPIREGGIGY